MPVVAMVERKRSRYGLVSVNVSGSSDLEAGKVLGPLTVVEQRSAGDRRR